MPTPDHLFSINENDLNTELQKWETSYINLTELLGKRQEVKKEMLSRLKMWLPVRNEILKHLSKLVENIEKKSDVFLKLKIGATVVNCVANAAFIAAFLMKKDVSGGCFSSVNGAIGAFDFGLELFKLLEMDSKIKEIRSILQKERQLAFNFCDTAKELEDLRIEICRRQQEYNASAITKIFQRHRIWTFIHGQSPNKEGQDAEVKIFAPGNRLKSFGKAPLKVASHAQGGVNLTTAGIICFVGNASQGLIASLSAVNVVIAIVGGISLAKEYQNGSDFLKDVKASYNEIVTETKIISQLKNNLTEEMEQQQKIDLNFERKLINDAKEGLLFLRDKAKKR